MRSIWTGSIGFGLVNIPVKLYSASEESSLNLDMLDKKDLSNIKFMRVNELTGKKVEWKDIVKGYKYNEDYVVLSDEDFEKANAKKTKVIEIVDFVEENDIDSIYYEKPYYLEPDKAGVRAYALLREALKETKKVGVATFVLRNKEGLAIIKPLKDVIVLNRIRFHEEIRDTKSLELPTADVKGKELEMAIKLIDQNTKAFNIKEYRDTYTEELMKVIEAKAKGKKTTYKPLKVVSSKSHDLMAQLKASLERSPKKRKKAA